MFSSRKFFPGFSLSSGVVAVAHAQTPMVSMFSQAGSSFQRYPDPYVLPTDSSSDRANSVAFSPDGDHLAVAHAGAPYLTVYAYRSNSFFKLPDPSELPSGEGMSLSYSSDGSYLAVAHRGVSSSSSPTGFRGPYLTIYSRSGDTYTKLEPPGINGTYIDGYGIEGMGLSVSFLPEGNLLALGHVNVSADPNRRCLMIFSRSGDVFSEISGFTSPGTGTCASVSFSRDGNYLAAAHTADPHLTVFSRSGNTFTKLESSGITEIYNRDGVSFSPDGKYLATTGSTQILSIYSRSGDTFTKLPNPSTMPTAGTNSARFSPDGKYLFVPQDSKLVGSLRECLTIYSISSGGVFTKVSSDASFLAGPAYGVAFLDPVLGSG